jgi:hypothetical protein
MKTLSENHTGGAARHFSANYMPFAGAEIFVREHACVRASGKICWSFFDLRSGIFDFSAHVLDNQ